MSDPPVHRDRIQAGGDVVLVVYTAEPGSADEQALALLGSWTAPSTGAMR